MDELTFRRTIYADPHTQDPSVVQAAKKDPAKQQFWQDIKRMDARIQDAVEIDVPDHLMHKLLFKQSTVQSSEKPRKKQAWYLGIAASVALMIGLTFSLSNSIGTSSLEKDVFAHVDHDVMAHETAKGGTVSIEGVNAKLASFNGEMKEQIGNILSANYCYLNKIKSLHLIIQNGEDLMSVFVLPDEITGKTSDNFSQASMIGTSFLLDSAKVILVGTDGQELSTLEENVRKSFAFST